MKTITILLVIAAAIMVVGSCCVMYAGLAGILDWDYVVRHFNTLHKLGFWGFNAAIFSAIFTACICLYVQVRVPVAKPV